MNDEQIKNMADRFLQWKLPEDFAPDAGISFKRDFNENTDHPMKHEPSGTNLLTAAQAQEMVRFITEGLAIVTSSTNETELRDLREDLEEYFESRADAEFEYDGTMTGNEEMRLLVAVRAALPSSPTK